VDVRTGAEATAASVLALEPDAVIVATGGRAGVDVPSKWHPLPVPGSDQPFVIDHERALLHATELGGRVVLLDAVGHIEAVGLGELLARSGVDVIVACPLPMPMLLDAETMAAALPRMARAGALWRPNTAMVSVGDHEVTLIDTLSLRLDTVDPVDTVVVRTHGRPDDRLFHELEGRVPEIVRVGDAVAVRLADRAIFDGHLAGRRL
jgi:2,4-dienoyl-CoA reductase (NADPH2)